MSECIPPIILASASPRRKRLLAAAQILFDCRPVDIDETRNNGEIPEDFVLRMAREKAAAARRDLNGELRTILTADTVVVLDGDVLGKPTDRAHARAMLMRLSGETHEVLTGVCVLTADGREHLERVRTSVSFRRIGAEELERYLDTPEPYDKAGAYAIQGQAGGMVHRIQGSYTNVIGLPMTETLALLASSQEARS